ncbi:Retrovirus-related Pol polyprotein from transposon RE1-like protein [Drosera capensis]
MITITLSIVEDYLVWRAQMESFLMSYGFIGFVDGFVVSPPMHLLQASSAPVLNPDYFQWQRIDQMVRSWIFATLSRDILVEVLNLKLAREIWDRLHHRFMSVCMARSIELKRKLTSLRKASSDSMEKYLRDIKILADSLAAINSPVCNADLIEHTLMALHQAFAAAPRSSGGRGRFKGGGSGGRSSQPQSRRGSFPGQVSRPSKGILGDRPTLLPDRSVPFVGLSHNNVVCQTCYQTGHPASTCPSRYAPQSVQAFATGLTGGSNEAV